MQHKGSTDQAHAHHSWHSLFSSMPLPFIIVNSEDVIIYANEMAEAFFLTSSARLQTHSIASLIGHNHDVINLLNAAKSQKSSVRHKQIYFELQSHIYADVIVYPTDDTCQNYAIIIQYCAATSAVNTHNSLHKSTHHLSTIARVLAHEIKNPLAGIRGAAQLLSMDGHAPQQPLTQLITAETDRITRLIDHMEQFGVGAPTQQNYVNIHAVLGHVKQLIEAAYGDTIEFIEYFDPSLPHIWGAQDQLIQLILNLIKNAVEACINTEKPVIALKTSYKAGLWITQDGGSKVHLPLEICVIDNGCGISDSIMKNMFEPFNTSKASGRGLGLALVAKIMRDHGGLIDVQSAPGHTQFRMIFPLIK